MMTNINGEVKPFEHYQELGSTGQPTLRWKEVEMQETKEKTDPRKGYEPIQDNPEQKLERFKEDILDKENFVQVTKSLYDSLYALKEEGKFIKEFWAVQFETSNGTMVNLYHEHAVSGLIASLDYKIIVMSHLYYARAGEDKRIYKPLDLETCDDTDRVRAQDSFGRYLFYHFMQDDGLWYFNDILDPLEQSCLIKIPDGKQNEVIGVDT